MDIIKELGISLPLLITQIIGFLILMVVLHRVFTTKVFSILDARQADIKATYDQMDADRKRMQDTQREYEARLAGIEAEAREKIQAAVLEAQSLRANMIADAQKQVETLLSQGRNETERERQKSFLEMRQQIVSLAIGAASKVVGDSLDSARQNKLVDDFISGVGTAAAHGGNGTGKGIGTA